MATTSGEVADEVAAAAPAIAGQDTETTKVVTNPLEDYTFPVAEFARARSDQRGRPLPQIIAHRGYKAKYPENTLLAFREAIKAGATALETDTRLTKDQVVVLSHDPNLKLFGHDKKLVDCTWDEIKDMRTSAPPHLPMLRLQDLLVDLLQPECKGIWLLLDIKSNEEPEPLMRLIAAAITSVRVPSHEKPWNQRILLGLWAAKQLKLAATFLPGFPALQIGFSFPYARRNFSDPHLGSVFLVESLLGLGGGAFIRDRHTKPGPTMAWTVNDRDQAEWCARRRLDGLITDDPAVISHIWEKFEPAKEPWMPVTPRAYLHVLYIFYLVNFRFAWFAKVLGLDETTVRSVVTENKKSQ